jgi:hypothetical protein
MFSSQSQLCIPIDEPFDKRLFLRKSDSENSKSLLGLDVQAKLRKTGSVLVSSMSQHCDPSPRCIQLLKLLRILFVKG